MSRIEIDSSDVLSRAWELSKKHGLILALLVFASTLIVQLISGGATPDSIQNITPGDTEKILKVYMDIWASPLLWISMFISTLFELFILKFILDVTKNPECGISLDSLKIPFMTYVKAFCVKIICGFAICVGLGFCIIPGVFLAVRLLFAEVYQLENNEAGIGEALSASWQMTKDNFGQLLLLGIICVFVALSGLLLCCVGVFFTKVIVDFCLIVAYLALKENLN